MYEYTSEIRKEMTSSTIRSKPFKTWFTASTTFMSTSICIPVACLLNYHPIAGAKYTLSESFYNASSLFDLSSPYDILVMRVSVAWNHACHAYMLFMALTCCAVHLHVLTLRPDSPKRAERNSKSHFGRHYHPMLYPQLPNVRNSSHNSTWYAISAYIDMRPLAYGGTPTFTLIVIGPLWHLLQGMAWSARILIRPVLATVTDLECTIPYYGINHIDMATHGRAIVSCAAGSKWALFQTLSQELGVCLVAQTDTESGCSNSSIVPVGVPPRYPKYPYAWGDRYIDVGVPIGSSREPPSPDEIEYREGKGPIAVCVPGVRGEQYVDSLQFFLEHYHRLGVDTVFMYMHQPGPRFVGLVDNIVAQQKSGDTAGRPQLVVLPWCIQVGATFGCKPGQPQIQMPGFFDVEGSNYGQRLVHEDCLYRAFGTYRWVVYVDLDEYILPRRPDVLTLPNLIDMSVSDFPKHAPAEFVFKSALYKNCLPALSGTSVPQFIELARRNGDIVNLPRPMWAAARVSTFSGQSSFGSKFMCDPYSCDVVGIHFAETKLCQLANTKQALYMFCDTLNVSSHDAIVHHSRAQNQHMRQYTHSAVPTCENITGVQEIDWTMTRFSSPWKNE